jgi:hypothetical protein
MGLSSRERELEIFRSHGCFFQDLPEIIYYCLFLQSGQLDPKQLIEQEATLEEGVQVLKLQSCRHSYDHTIFLPQTSLIITKSATLWKKIGQKIPHNEGY